MRPLKFKLFLKGKFAGYEVHRKAKDDYATLYSLGGYKTTVAKGNVAIHHSEKSKEILSTFNCITSHPLDYIQYDEKRQFTGMHDVNGAEIYEGDRIRVHQFGQWPIGACTIGFECGAFIAYPDNALMAPSIPFQKLPESIELIK